MVIQLKSDSTTEKRIGYNVFQLQKEIEVEKQRKAKAKAKEAERKLKELESKKLKELKPYTDTTLIQFDDVIREFKITNLQAEKKVKTSDNSIIDYSQSNKDWVQSQIDYFNSGFTDLKAWQKFLTIANSWFYNATFKRYKKTGSEGKKIKPWIDMYTRDALAVFAEVYTKRKNLCMYFRGLADRPTDLNNIKLLNKGISLQTNKDQFKHIFQAYIGSLSNYMLGLGKLDDWIQRNEVDDSLSLEMLLEENKDFQDRRKFSDYMRARLFEKIDSTKKDYMLKMYEQY